MKYFTRKKLAKTLTHVFLQPAARMRDILGSNSATIALAATASLFMLAKELEGIILGWTTISGSIVVGWTLTILWVFTGGAAGIHLLMIKRCIKTASDTTPSIEIAVGNQ
jgi:hypothetical protein